jgi:phenylalanine-4-hydroxylase
MPQRSFQVTEQIPEYLQPYIAHQDASLYTPMDHASWRFILKISQAFFAKHAHPMYLNGLRETGISTDRIPLISEMDQKLRRFGWRAVPVSGFIPPAVFMEFLSRGILPIACDMRKIENISYTPAPDIVHEAAGHAPIIAEPSYAAYLRHYGELAEKAIYSKQDLDVYEAVRNLSDVKEDPSSTEAQIAAAQKRLDDAAAAVDHDTEATQLGRMGWWTIEYGLLGDEKEAKIYGAGLLSSVSESYNCLNPEVKKVPFSVDCVDVTYDITKPQPQLFVARDFDALVKGLDDLAERMAYRRGGIEGLEKARKAAVPTTSVLETGLQISGTLSRYRQASGGSTQDASGAVSYLHFQGPTQLCFENRELDGQGPEYHREGFGTALGFIKGFKKSPAELSPADLETLGFKKGSKGRMEFESGVVVEGELVSYLARGGKNLILTFHNCSVKLGSEVLFDPSWGTYDMACGSKVVSVFGGAADRSRYLAATGGFGQPPAKPKTNLTESNRALNELYAQVRALRTKAQSIGPEIGTAFGDFVTELSGKLAKIHDELEKNHRSDWLLRFELLELDQQYQLKSPWAKQVRARLNEATYTSKDKADMISRGLAVLNSAGVAS